MQNLKILLVGGEGYVGKVISKNLIKNKFKITSFDNLIYNQPKPKSNKLFQFIKGDITNTDDLKKLFKKDYDFLVLLAGLVGDPITKKYPKSSKEINLKGVKKVINFYYKSKIKKILFISTCSNYGVINKNIFAKENYKLNPKSLYAKHKVNIEKYLISKKNETKPYVILRFSTAYGTSERMRFDLTINQFVKDLFFGKRIEVYDAETFRPYCYTSDFAKVIIKLIKNKDKRTINEIYNIGSTDNNFSKRMIVNKISKFFKKKDIKYLDGKKDPRNYKVNFGKFKSNFKFKFMPIDKGIDQIITFLKKNKSSLRKTSNKLGNYHIKTKKI